MSGFKDDIISILRQNVLLHGEAIGCIIASDGNYEARELYNEMANRKLLVSMSAREFVFFYDYVVITAEWGIETLLNAFSLLSENGIIIVQAPNEKIFNDRYTSLFGKFTATKLKYDRNYYMVIHSGVDYGN